MESKAQYRKGCVRTVILKMLSERLMYGYEIAQELARRSENVFALGDASSLPTSKTGAAIRKQAPVLTANLVAQIRGKGSDAFESYNGYTACPLVTGYGKLVMAEFDYDLKPTPTFPIDQTKERWSMYQVKRYVLPALYWNRILKGRA